MRTSTATWRSPPNRSSTWKSWISNVETIAKNAATPSGPRCGCRYETPARWANELPHSSHRQSSAMRPRIVWTSPRPKASYSAPTVATLAAARDAASVLLMTSPPCRLLLFGVYARAVARSNPALTTTTYAILGQLAWGEATTYELVKA